MAHYLKLVYLNLKELLFSPYKWFVVFFLILLYRIEFMSDTGVGVGKILQVTMVFGLIVLLLREKQHIIRFVYKQTNTPVKSLALLYTYALISALWAFVPTFAFFISLQNILMILLFIWAFAQFGSLYGMERGLIFFTFTIVAFEFVASRIGTTSIFNHILPSGSLSAMMLAYCTGEYMHCAQQDIERKKLLKNAAITYLFFLIVNTSGGANASAVVAIGVAMLLGGKKVYAVLLLLIGLFLFFNQEMIDDIILTLMPGKNMETIKIGNGRETIWEYLLLYANQKPWFGWGFACIERVKQLGIIGGQSLSDAHSNYIGMYGSLGIIGCCLFGGHLLSTAHYLFKRISQPGFLGLFAAFTCATVNGYSYGFLSGKTCSITIVYFMIVILSFYYDFIPLEENESEDELGA